MTLPLMRVVAIEVNSEYCFVRFQQSEDDVVCLHGALVLVVLRSQALFFVSWWYAWYHMVSPSAMLVYKSVA
jgi:hypothetical protein